MLTNLFSIFNPTGQSLAAKFWQSGNGGKGFSPVCSNKKKTGCRISKGVKGPCDGCPNQNYQPLSLDMFEAHMGGQGRYGVYPLGQDGFTPWVAVDLDNHKGGGKPKGRCPEDPGGFTHLRDPALCVQFQFRERVSFLFVFQGPGPGMEGPVINSDPYRTGRDPPRKQRRVL